MAEEDILNLDVGSVASGFMDNISQAGSWIVWIIVIGALVGALLYLISFKHSVGIRVLTRNGNNLPVKDRAREIKVDGVVYWKLMKRKHIIPVPPAESLVIRKSGANPKFYAEFSYSDETGYVPLEYDVTTDNFNDKLKMIQHGKVVQDPFQPFTSNQRSLYVMQLRKSETRRKKDILERITALATPIVLVMLVICILIFWEDVAKPGKEIAELNLQMQEKTLVVLDQIVEISNQNARIVQTLTGENLNITQQVTG